MRFGNQNNVPGAPGNFGGMAGNPQNGRDIVEETRARQFPQFVPPQLGSSNVANAMPGGQQVTGAIGNVAGMMNQQGVQMTPNGYRPFDAPVR
jgi:hypothetical protein